MNWKRGLFLICAMSILGLGGFYAWKAFRPGAQATSDSGAPQGTTPTQVTDGTADTSPPAGRAVNPPKQDDSISERPRGSLPVLPKEFPKGVVGYSDEDPDAPLMQQDEDIAASTAPVTDSNTDTVSVPDSRSGTGGASVVPVLEGSADPDNDGLTNDQERQQGTDPNKADSDGDGLTDGQEVRTYQSNPNKADTDGDGYPDGVEVKGGYNPSGPGKL